MSKHGRAALALALVVTACGSDPVAPVERPEPQFPRSMGAVTAMVDGSSWASGFVTVRHTGGFMEITAMSWPWGDEMVHHLYLSLDTTLNSTPQAIGLGHRLNAWLNVNYFGTWTATSGTIALTSIDAERAVGTFTFSGEGSVGVTPPVLAVTEGRFDVRLR